MTILLNPATTPELSGLHYALKSGRFDDLNGEESLSAGSRFATEFDLIRTKYGPVTAIGALLPYYNGVYVDGEERRDPEAPFNRVIFQRFTLYFLEEASQKTSSFDGLVTILEITKAAMRHRCRPIEKYLLAQEKGRIDNLVLQLEKRAASHDISVLADVVALSMLDLEAHSIERTGMKRPPEELLSTHLAALFKRLIPVLAKRYGADVMARHCQSISANADTPYYIRTSAEMARRALPRTIRRAYGVR